MSHTIFQRGAYGFTFTDTTYRRYTLATGRTTLGCAQCYQGAWFAHYGPWRGAMRMDDFGTLVQVAR